MWWIIGITVLALISAILIIRMAMKDAEENMNDTIAKMYDMDEHSPESIISDELIKKTNLRNKLNKIETKRDQTETEIKTFGDFDHSRIDGK